MVRSLHEALDRSRLLAYCPLALAVMIGLPGCARPGGSSSPEPGATAPAEASTTVEPEATGASAEEGQEVESSEEDHPAGTVRPRRNESLQDLLETRSPGVQVRVHPDGSLSIRIRGASSFISGNHPLIVVDGTPTRFGIDGRVRGLNVRDIESIRVLKDPTEISLWGVRGGNGVIVITTLRPMP